MGRGHLCVHHTNVYKPTSKLTVLPLLCSLWWCIQHLNHVNPVILTVFSSDNLVLCKLWDHHLLTSRSKSHSISFSNTTPNTLILPSFTLDFLSQNPSLLLIESGLSVCCCNKSMTTVEQSTTCVCARLHQITHENEALLLLSPSLVLKLCPPCVSLCWRTLQFCTALCGPCKVGCGIWEKANWLPQQAPQHLTD